MTAISIQRELYSQVRVSVTDTRTSAGKTHEKPHLHKHGHQSFPSLASSCRRWSWTIYLPRADQQDMNVLVRVWWI